MKSPLLASLFDEVERKPLSVSELNAQVRSALEQRFKSVWLEGEIYNFSAAASGHWYFTLRDAHSQVKAACFRGSNYKIRFQPFDGLQVRVRAAMSVYEPRGEYQILVETLDPVGEGAFKVAFEQLKAKLEREGLFDADLKRELPLFPKKIGVVTSPNGAAIHDIFNVLMRRTRSVSIVLIPARVQGEGAGEELSRAVELANKFNAQNAKNADIAPIDVLIVGRGGGSREDLWAFNDEKLARTIRRSKIPVVSAVGHETDFTIADFVADLRAPTPSAAAELVAAREDQLEAFLIERRSDLRQLLQYKLLESRDDLRRLRTSPAFYEISRRLQNTRQNLEQARHRIETLTTRCLHEQRREIEKTRQRIEPLLLKTRTGAARGRLELAHQKLSAVLSARLEAKNARFRLNAAALDALSPLAVLHRGFASVRTEKDAIRSVKQLEKGAQINLRFADGEARCTIEEIAETPSSNQS